MSNKTKVDKGSQKKYPSIHQCTRREWALLCSRLKYGAIPTSIEAKDGILDKGLWIVKATFPSRRQAKKNKSKYIDAKKPFRLVDA